MKKVIVISVIVVICLIVFVALMSQPSHQKINYYLLIKKNLQQRSSSYATIEQEFFCIFFNCVTEKREIVLVNSIKMMKKLVGSTCSIPASLKNSAFLGKINSATYYLNWKWHYISKTQSNILEIIISEKRGDLTFAYIKFSVPSMNRERTLVFHDASRILLNQLVGKNH